MCGLVEWRRSMEAGMKSLLKNPFVVGILVFIFAGIVFGLISGPAVCRDGWHSSSIGTRGACSHHGGIKRGWGGILATIVGLAAGFWRYVTNESAEAAAREAARSPQPRSSAKPAPCTTETAAPPESAPQKYSESYLAERASEGQRNTEEYLKQFFDDPDRVNSQKIKRRKRPTKRKT